ncbi:MAG: DNA polymerase III subunit gamma/tau [Hyphomicrobiaceae bacterium]
MAKKTELFPDSATEAAPATADRAVASPYVVLARKYRPQTFEDLIGQDAMVQTLENAFASDRISQGYMLTGVRGVGKTTTARILARALNYSKPSLPDRPTTKMPDFGVHCQQIMESRHPDVLEMDAASNTGVDNIRDIIESVRYMPMAARYKVYVIDEVHMLSKGAFNALLKTLEEPPPHVKFIFATTEVRKVPVTVLSRCQRFDLRRVDVATLAAHFKRIVGNEGWIAEDEALTLIARAAEGSVRDGLSMLDQAAAMGRGQVEAAGVRAMLGLADRSRIFDLLEHLFNGAAAEALALFAALHRDGADPSQVLADLGEAVHLAARIKIAGADGAGEAAPAEERRRANRLAETLSVPLLSRTWQMLMKGFEEAAKAPDPLAAADMVLIRIAHTADLPSPEDLMRALGGEAVVGRARRPAGNGEQRAATPQAEASGAVGTTEFAPRPDFDDFADDAAEDETGEDDGGMGQQPRSFAEVVALAGRHRDAKLKVHLEEHVSLVRFDATGSIDIHLLPQAPSELGNELREKLNKWTSRRWIVALSPRPGEPPLGVVERQRRAKEVEDAKNHPAVKAVLAQFPDGKVNVKHTRPDRDDDKAAG